MSALLPLYLPMERNTEIFQFEQKIYFILKKKDILFPVDRVVLDCLWREIILCTLAEERGVCL